LKDKENKDYLVDKYYQQFKKLKKKYNEEEIHDESKAAERVRTLSYIRYLKKLQKL